MGVDILPAMFIFDLTLVDNLIYFYSLLTSDLGRHFRSISSVGALTFS